MTPPSEETLRQAVIDFIDNTSNEAIRVLPCAVCARETSISELVSYTRTEIPHKELLIPHTPHPKHDIFDGMLLYPGGVHGNAIDICNECFPSLQKNRRPKFSLANDMWIGEIPPELATLSFPERILIAMYYPAAYIFKLFPKKPGAHAWDPSKLYKGLKGNVSTYRLDPKLVAKMVDHSTMPPPAQILSAVIAITFLGPTGIPEKTMPEMFRVRRARVRTALAWLKENNPLYAHINISDENLNQLPEDGIPEELIMAAKHSSDLSLLNKEEDGYVPKDTTDEEEERK
jgi:hypothetical protein